MNILSVFAELLAQSGFAAITWQQCVMLLVSFVLLYLAIKKQFEPLLLLPIAFGMFLANLPLAGLMNEADHWYQSGVLRIMYMGVKSSLFPCLDLHAVGAMTDFGPLIANPVSFFSVQPLSSVSMLHLHSQMQPDFSHRVSVQRSVSSAVLMARPRSISQITCSGSCSSDRRSRVFLHGSDPADPAADHEASYNKERASDRYEAVKKSQQSREGCIPGIRCSVLLPASSVRSTASWYADAR